MLHSENINEIAKALAKSQGEMKPCIKDSFSNYKKKYSSIDAILHCAIECLSKNDICVVQNITNYDKGVTVETRLIHSSGQWMVFGPFSMPAATMTDHKIASASTYARRYSLCSAVGIAGDTDDDGTEANEEISKPIVNNQEPVQQSNHLISNAQLKYLRSLITVSQEAAIIEFYKVKDLSEITISQAKTCIDKAKGSVNG